MGREIELGSVGTEPDLFRLNVFRHHTYSRGVVLTPHAVCVTAFTKEASMRQLAPDEEQSYERGAPSANVAYILNNNTSPPLRARAVAAAARGS